MSYVKITEDSIICQKGVIIRKNSRILLANINSTNTKQGIVQKLFGLSTLSIDSGSANTSTTEEISFTTDNATITHIIHLLEQKNITFSQNINSTSENTNVQSNFFYSYTPTLKLLNSVFSLLWGIIVILPFAIFFSILITQVSIDGEAPGSISDGIFGAILISSIMLVLFFVVHYIKELINSYNLTYQIYEDHIDITQGMFVRVNHSFQLDKIRGIVIETNAIKRFFGYATIKAQVIGFMQANGNSNAVELGKIIPLCKISQINDILKDLNLNYQLEKKQTKAKSYFTFFSMPLLFISIFNIISIVPAAAITALYNNTSVIFIVGVVISLLDIIVIGLLLFTSKLSLKYEGISIQEDGIITYAGGLFTSITIIKFANLIAVEKVTTPKREKNGICSYVFHFYTNSIKNTVTIHSQELNDYEKYTSLLNQ